jgi:uncharacterized protein YdaU (DUF1376 family)
MKETFYFSHDNNARTDSKIKKLLHKHGLLGYGIFWAIVEDLYSNANAIPKDYDGIAFDLRLDVDVVKSVIEDFDLFVLNAGQISSNSVQRRLNERAERSGKAKESARKRWKKSESDANALPTQTDSNAIKERKVKESKGNTSTDVDVEREIDDNDNEVETVEEEIVPEFVTDGLADLIIQVEQHRAEMENAPKTWEQVAEILKSDRWIRENVRMSNKLSDQEYDQAVDKFTSDQRAKLKPIKSESDVRSHFMSWAPSWRMLAGMIKNASVPEKYYHDDPNDPVPRKVYL